MPRLTVLLLVASLVLTAQTATSISCAFCVSGVATINQKIVTTPDMEAQMGLQISLGCDQITVQETRLQCRATFIDNFNVFYGNFSGQPDQQPETLCASMGFC